MGDPGRGLAVLFRGGTVSGLSDAALLARFVERGDPSAFSAMVARHGPAVWAVCRRTLRDPNDADDAFQATFLVLSRRAGSVRRPERLGGWLHGVACKVAARARRDSLKRSTTGNAAEPYSEGSQADDADRRERETVLHEELARLPGKYRDPIVLCHLEGCTHDEAAARLGWPLGTVRGRLARGRDRLRDRLARRGLGASAGLADLGRLAPAPSLIEATVRTVTKAAGSLSAAGLISARGLFWAEEVILMTLLTKWTTVAVTTVGALMIGTGAFAWTLGAGERLVGRDQDEPNPAAKAVAEPTQATDDKATIAGLRKELESYKAILSQTQKSFDDYRREAQDEVKNRERLKAEREDNELRALKMIDELALDEAENEVLRAEVEGLKKQFQQALQASFSAGSVVGLGGGRGPGDGEDARIKTMQERVDEYRAQSERKVTELRERFLDLRRKLSVSELKLALSKARFNELTNNSAAASDLERRLSEIEAGIQRLNAAPASK